MLGHGFEGVIDVFGRIDLLVDPNELLVVKKEACTSRFSSRVRNVEAVAHGSIDVTEEREGEAVFAREGELLGHGIHRDSEGFDPGGGEFLR
jgi:hypothetical protein